MQTLPPAFREQMQVLLGNEFESFEHALSTEPPVSIRVNPEKNYMHGGNRVPWADNGVYLQERPVFTLDPVFHGGAYYVQEASSMFLEQALKKSVDLSIPLKVLDLCAAPGGKSTHMLSLLNNDSLLVSNEVIRSRASILSENVQKWGYPNCIVTNNDPKDFTSLEGFFDVIVIDAPCSGEGLFRKDPEAIREWSTQNVALCSARQKRILHDAWPALKENGILIYCTCTYNEEEDENNLVYLSKQESLEFIDLHPDPSLQIKTITKDNAIGYRFMPHLVRGEGFFISAMRKKSDASKIRMKPKKKLTLATKSISSRLSEWLTSPEAFQFVMHDDLVFSFPEKYVSQFEMLLQTLKIIYAGTNLATLKHEKAIPEHALALSTQLNGSHFPTIDLDHNQAIQFLRRESIHIPSSQKGYHLVTHKSVGLGWMNVLDNRSNNLYPQEWRIRMAN